MFHAASGTATGLRNHEPKRRTIMPSRCFKAALAATALLLAAPLPALAQAQGQEQHHVQSDSGTAAPPAPEPGTMQRMPQGSMSGGGTMPMMGGGGTGMGMMDCPMMSQMMDMHPEMMSMLQGRMGAGDGMMGQGGGPGMMMRQGAMDLDAGVVTPIQHLSTDDVRHYFEHRLKAMGNDRLKLGEVMQTDDDTITVDIVTVEDSLVDRLEVDRHSGQIHRAQ